MNVIVKSPAEMPFATDLRLVFKSIDNLQLNYNWLITDLECNYYPEELIGNDHFWLTGSELTKIVNRDDIQFIWGVFSGFLPDVEIDLSKPDDFPYADCNPGFWVPNPKIQHPEAQIEIVCWDSTLTLFLARDDYHSKKFMSYFSNAQLLGE